MSFTTLKLHPDLLRGLKELGFSRPTPIQTDAIPPALEGRDLLACAMTGSGKTAAFVLPILHRLMDRPRGTTRALVLTPTRELAAQIVESLEQLAVHTPLSGAAVFGGVGMGPQEHAFRSGVDVIVATPGRLLDHFRSPYAKLSGLEHLVLDEADRMLDMGFLPDIRRVLKHLPAKRQTLFFSATMPPPIAALAKEMLRDPVIINLQRQAAPAVGITQAIYPVPQELKSALLVALLERGDMDEALVFTRTKHRANRVAQFLQRAGIEAERIHGNRSQNQRTQALEGFKSGRYRVLVATDIAARGIDVEALGHVVNFDVPLVPEDYIHRVGRTARAEATGDAFTFVAPDEESDLRAIERAVGKRLPRVTVPDFDYSARPAAKLEIPLSQRLAEMRANRGGGRSRQPHRAAASHGRSAGSGRRSSPPASSPRERLSHPPRPATRDTAQQRERQSQAPSPQRERLSHPPRPATRDASQQRERHGQSSSPQRERHGQSSSPQRERQSQAPRPAARDTSQQRERQSQAPRPVTRDASQQRERHGQSSAPQRERQSQAPRAAAKPTTQQGQPQPHASRPEGREVDPDLRRPSRSPRRWRR